MKPTRRISLAIRITGIFACILSAPTATAADELANKIKTLAKILDHPQTVVTPRTCQIMSQGEMTWPSARTEDPMPFFCAPPRISLRERHGWLEDITVVFWGNGHENRRVFGLRDFNQGNYESASLGKIRTEGAVSAQELRIKSSFQLESEFYGHPLRVTEFVVRTLSERRLSIRLRYERRSALGENLVQEMEVEATQP